MSRMHGNKARLYVAIASGGTAEPLLNTAQWTLVSNTDKVETTSQGDTSKNYVAGLPDAQGTFNGFYDDTSSMTYTASQDGVARKFYLYPTTANTGRYFFGTGFFDFQLDTSVSDANKMQGTFAAATSLQSVGI